MSDAKLVRDKIPEIIRESGVTPIIRVAQPEEHAGLLRLKLVEEVEEFLESENHEELADVLEVIFAIAATVGLSTERLEQIRVRKRDERGGFDRGIVWEGNVPSALGSDSRKDEPKLD